MTATKRYVGQKAKGTFMLWQLSADKRSSTYQRGTPPSYFHCSTYSFKEKVVRDTYIGILMKQEFRSETYY